MNFIFGIILLAMFILALRVIWATALQLLGTCVSNVSRLSCKAPSSKPITGDLAPNPS
jgi:hypothetical protein